MKYVFLEFINNINLCFISYFLLGKVIVINNFKILEVYSISGIIFVFMVIVSYGFVLYIFLFWDWLKK